MPPPTSPSTRPLAIVSPIMFTFRPELIVKMRNAGVPPAALRSTVTLPPLSGLRVTSSSMAGKALSRSIGPTKSLLKTIWLLTVLFALASRIAWRSEPAPLSLVVVTK
jgi:hypothetical protein